MKNWCLKHEHELPDIFTTSTRVKHNQMFTREVNLFFNISCNTVANNTSNNFLFSDCRNAS